MMFVRPFLLILTLAAESVSVAASAQDLLPIEKAYRVESHYVGKSIIEFDYQIAPGYILYKDRFSAELVGMPGRLEVELPPAQNKLDHVTNHQVEFYRDRVTVRVKLPSVLSKPVSGVVATAQGCAVEAGVCYPPVKTTWNSPSTLDLEKVTSGRHPGDCQGKAAKGFVNEVTQVFRGSC